MIVKKRRVKITDQENFSWLDRKREEDWVTLCKIPAQFNFASSDILL